MTRLYDATIGQFDQFKRLLADQGNLTTEELEEILRQPKLIDAMMYALREQLTPMVSGADKFAPYLLSLENQLTRLREYNHRFWNGCLIEDQFEAAGQLEARIDWETAGHEHAQSVNRLDIFYVDFGSPEQTVEMWWKVLAGVQPNAWRWDGLETDKKHLRLHSSAKQYAPGIHLVRINLLAHWEPQVGRSIIQVREQTSRSGETLAAGEVLAAYGLHDELLRQMDGESLPYADLAGYECKLPGDRPWPGCPGLRWRRTDREVRLGADWTGHVNDQWAAPVLEES